MPACARHNGSGRIAPGAVQPHARMRADADMAGGLSSARLVNVVRAAAAQTLGVLQKICETPPCSIDKYPPK